MKRTILRRYADPLDAVWVTTAKRIGLAIERSDEVYASTTGDGVLTIGEEATLDEDDCLAQMILHELCHALVQGPSHLRSPDWGLDNMSPDDEVREQACLTLQAELTRGYGLRQLLAPTTDFRAFYDALPPRPFEIDDDVCVALAKDGWGRVDEIPFGPHLRQALEATSAIASIASKFSDSDATLWSVFSRANEPA